MKKLIVLTAVLTLSSTAFAATVTSRADSKIKTQGYETQQQAFDAGFKVMDEINSMSSRELNNKLNVLESQLLTNSLKVTSVEVTTQAFANNSHKIEYRAIVDVDYQYKHRESHRD